MLPLALAGTRSVILPDLPPAVRPNEPLRRIDANGFRRRFGFRRRRRLRPVEGQVGFVSDVIKRPIGHIGAIAPKLDQAERAEFGTLGNGAAERNAESPGTGAADPDRHPVPGDAEHLVVVYFQRLCAVLAGAERQRPPVGTREMGQPCFLPLFLRLGLPWRGLCYQPAGVPG